MVLSNEQDGIGEGRCKDGLGGMHSENQFSVKKIIGHSDVSLENKVPFVAYFFISFYGVILTFGVIKALVAVQIGLRNWLFLDLLLNEMFFLTKGLNLEYFTHVKTSEMIA